MEGEYLNLDEYLLNVDDFFQDYVIQEERPKANYTVFYGVMKNTPQAVKIYKRTFPHQSSSARQRFLALMEAFNKGVVLADNIFLGLEQDIYYLYVVEPAFMSWSDKFIQLSRLLKLDIDYFRKKRLFHNLVVAVKSLHALGEAHFELCPKNIWVEDQFLVYLRPFKLLFDEEDKRRSTAAFIKSAGYKSSLAESKTWYVAPEQLFKEVENRPTRGSHQRRSINEFDFAADIWSLGCVFSDMFVSLTPLFQSVDSEDRVLRYFEVLGAPEREEVFYLDDETFEEVHRRIATRAPLIDDLVVNVSPQEAQILLETLQLDPNKRPNCDLLLTLQFFKSFKQSKTPTFLQGEVNTLSTQKSNATDLRKSQLPATLGPQERQQGERDAWWKSDPIVSPSNLSLGGSLLPKELTKGDRSSQRKISRREEGSMTTPRKPASVANGDFTLILLEVMRVRNLSGLGRGNVSIACKFDVKGFSGAQDRDSISEFIEVKANELPISLNMELQLRNSMLVEYLKAKPFEVQIFVREEQYSSRGLDRGEDISLLGSARIDPSILTHNLVGYDLSLIKNPRALNSWYHIQDASFPERSIGQIQVGIKLVFNFVRDQRVIDITEIVEGRGQTNDMELMKTVKPLKRNEEKSRIQEYKENIKSLKDYIVSTEREYESLVDTESNAEFEEAAPVTTRSKDLDNIRKEMEKLNKELLGRLDLGPERSFPSSKKE